MRAITFALALLLAAWMPARGSAQDPPLLGNPAPAERGSQLQVFLVTMGQGDQVWEKFGHNAIWIHDPARGTDWAYNYGLFDFNSPGYWTRFLKGNWIYSLGVEDADRMVDAYRYFNRSVWVQELNLTSAQKAELQEFLEWNAQPENQLYNYDYFRDNCSTRVRDALDRVLGGQIRGLTEGVTTPTTYRWHSERLIADDKVSYTGLLAGLGPAADRPLSAWEEMFIPMVLRDRVREVTVTDDAGRPVPLVKSERMLFQAAREPERAEPPSWFWAYLVAGLGLGAAFALLARAAPASRAARVAFAVTGALWTLIIGTGGMILLGLLFTDHSIAHRNENLLQFAPFALPLVVLLPALAFGARWAAAPARWLAFGVAGLAVAGWVLQILPGLDQANGSLIALTLPAHLGLAWAAHRLGNSAAHSDGVPPASVPNASRRVRVR